MAVSSQPKEANASNPLAKLRLYRRMNPYRRKALELAIVGAIILAIGYFVTWGLVALANWHPQK